MASIRSVRSSAGAREIVTHFEAQEGDKEGSVRPVLFAAMMPASLATSRRRPSPVALRSMIRAQRRGAHPHQTTRTQAGVTSLAETSTIRLAPRSVEMRQPAHRFPRSVQFVLNVFYKLSADWLEGPGKDTRRAGSVRLRGPRAKPLVGNGFQEGRDLLEPRAEFGFPVGGAAGHDDPVGRATASSSARMRRRRARPLVVAVPCPGYRVGAGGGCSRLSRLGEQVEQGAIDRVAPVSQFQAQTLPPGRPPTRRL